MIRAVWKAASEEHTVFFQKIKSKIAGLFSLLYSDDTDLCNFFRSSRQSLLFPVAVEKWGFFDDSVFQHNAADQDCKGVCFL